MKVFHLFFLLFAFAFSNVASLQARTVSTAVTPPKTQTVTIKTSAVCEMCEKKIKKVLATHKGVKSVTMNMDTKEVKVTFNPSATNVDNIRKTISAAGYDADEVKANSVAYNKLAACCKKGSKCDMK
ncbi:MAG: heavy-metal-associated domain-containing protein [Bacteroidia bacterium]